MMISEEEEKKSKRRISFFRLKWKQKRIDIFGVRLRSKDAGKTIGCQSDSNRNENFNYSISKFKLNNAGHVVGDAVILLNLGLSPKILWLFVPTFISYFFSLHRAKYFWPKIRNAFTFWVESNQIKTEIKMLAILKQPRWHT
jgi:hypothetical protein